MEKYNSKVKLHIYGKYMGDLTVIHSVLDESNEYDLTYEYMDTGKGNRPDDIDYVVTAHRNPKQWRYDGNIIHAQHGLGCLPKIPRANKAYILKRYKKFYYALCVYGKVQKSWFDELGYPSERILTIGMPSSIELLSPVDEKERKNFLKMRKLDPTKKTVIYAPTWNQKEERGFFCLWWQDGREEERVEKFCRFITVDLGMNLIVRLHQKSRYSEDWIGKYRSIFNAYGVWTHYLDEDPYNLPYFKYSDILVGDLSNTNTYFYVMDKPVVHIGASPFKKKRRNRWAGMDLSDRAGYIIEDFDDMLGMIKDSAENPHNFSVVRKKTVDKYIDYVGEGSRQAILSEFRRLLQ